LVCFYGNRVDGEKLLVVQFGSGLIGSKISDKLAKRFKFCVSLKVDWTDVDSWVSNSVESFWTQFTYDKVEIVWAAGKAGFSANEEDVKQEIYNFSTIVNALREQFSSLDDVRFWLMGSAGGLFEGQTFVTEESEPNPKRPYGDLKLAQEKIVQDLFPKSVICRISSVFTNTNFKGRLGLIPILIRNGVQNKVSTIFGTESTIRDYILDEEIAYYVTNQILQNSISSGVVYLIGGQPVSIRTIINRIEDIVLKKLLIKYVRDPSNSSNISFSSRLKPIHLKTASFQIHLKVLYNNLLSNNLN